MNKDQAQRIIKDTFENKFDKARFTRFTVELLNLKSLAVNDPGATFNTNQVPNAYKPFINSFEKITDYKSGEHKLDVLVIRLNRETSLERARTMQRNFIAWYLRGDCDGEMKDAALAAFVSPDEEDWRFSLVKIDYSLGEDKKGRVKISEEFTPAKRWSFLVGSNENSHTAQSQIVTILEEDEKKPTFDQLEGAFNIEKVTKEFFKKYKELFFWTKETLDEIFIKDSKIRSDFETKNINTIDFSKKLLGQIVFLYFLQKKGWFGVARDADWGTGPKNFLRELFEGKHGKYKNFFNNILEPLFYDALRNDRSHNDDYYSNFNCKIPFLNGGLFDPINNYDWVHTDINLSDDLFSNEIITKEGDKGTGILDIFDRYNFTVKEDEPLEKEVAVDPEMLGKVFENLLEVKDRKSKGTYYTPREIVHYMCQQSLINYLDTEMEVKASKDDIEKLIKYGEQFGENNTDLIDSLKDIPESIIQNAKLIDEKLADIKVCDPAVGSGAFLVEMMGEIVRTRNVLTNYIKDLDRTIYNFKRDCIENSLYGVDIDPGAVEIAKLRLWLSLVVDEEDIKQIKPLPNLDYKIVCGNSLMSIEKNLFNQELFSELENLKKKFFDEINPNKKKELKDKISEIIAKITNGHKDFDFEIYFSEVLHRKGGFDIVIANPPYVRADSKNPTYLNFRRLLEKSGWYKTLYEKWDLFIPFIEKGLNLLNEHGRLNYIVSNSICTSKYAFKLLDLIQEKYYTLSIDYFEDMQVFNAGVIPVVLHIGKGSENSVNKIIRQSSFENILSKNIYSFSDFHKLGRNAFRKDYKYLIINIPVINLGDICYLSKGMVLNSDETSNKGAFTKNDLISDKQSNIYRKPYIEGKFLKKYYIEKIRYLEWGTKRVPGMLSRATFPELYERPKIMRGRVTEGTYDNKGLYSNDSIVIFLRFVDLAEVNNKSISVSIKKFNTLSRDRLEILSQNFNPKYILAIMNSKFANMFLNNIRRHRLENYFYPDDFRNLPIADISKSAQQEFSDLVDKILVITEMADYLSNSGKQAKVQEYEKQIDQLVYKLYGLTLEEIKIVEESH